MIIAFVVTMFIPESIAMYIGSVKLTPMFAVSMIIFPLLFIVGRIRWAWPELIVLLLFTCYFISIVKSSPLPRSIEAIGRMVLAAGVPYLIGRYLTQDTRRLYRVLGLLVTLLAVFAVMALLEAFKGINPHFKLWGIPYVPHPRERLGMTRAQGWTTHAIMFGLVNSILLPVVLVCVIEKLRVVGRWAIFKALALGLGCFLSLSTGAWGPAVLSVLLVGWDYLLKPIKPNIRWPTTGLSMLLGYFLLEVASGRPLLRILMMKLHLSSPEAWHYRWMLYHRVYSVMPGHWLLGHGLQTPEEFQGWGWSIDNNYLVILMQYGRVGLIVWIGLFVAVVLHGGKAVWCGYDTSYVRMTRAVVIGLFGIMMTQLSVALFSTAHVMFWLMLGLAVGGAQNCRREYRRIKQTVASRSARHRPIRKKYTPPPAPVPRLIYSASLPVTGGQS